MKYKREVTHCRPNHYILKEKMSCVRMRDFSLSNICYKPSHTHPEMYSKSLNSNCNFIHYEISNLIPHYALPVQVKLKLTV